MARSQRTTGTGSALDDQTMRARNQRQQRGGNRQNQGGPGSQVGGGRGRAGQGPQRTPTTTDTSSASPTTTGTVEQFTDPGRGWWNQQTNPYATKLMTDDPSGQAFWSSYGQNQLGWSPADPSASWFSQTYNPQALGAAMNATTGLGYSPMEGMTNAAQGLLGGGHAVNWDAGALVSSVMNALASGDMSTLAKTNPMLNDILLAEMGKAGPMGMVGALQDFLGAALQGIVPDNALQSLQAMLAYAGDTFFKKVGAAGDPKAGNMNAQNFAKFAQSLFGPTLGF